MTDKIFRPISVVVGITCLCLCVMIDLFYFSPDIIFGDEQRFLSSALDFVQTGNFVANGQRAWEMPGTALFFSVFVSLFNDTHAAIIPIRLVQASLLFSQAVLTGKIAEYIFEDSLAGLCAFAMTAYYPFFLYYQGLLLSETLFNTWLVAAIASLYWWRARKFSIDIAFVFTCVFFALATYTKATLTLLPPILIAAMTLGARDWRLTARAFFISALVYAVLLTPWWIRNYSLLDAFVPFTTGATQNLYLGNNPNNQTGSANWLTDVNPDVVTRLVGISGEVDRQRAFGREASEYIFANPQAFVHGMGLKFLRFWNVVPNAEEFNGLTYRLLSLASFAPTLVLSIICVVIWRRKLLLFAPLLLLFAYFTVLHTITIASLRYRLPLEPFLIALASAPVAMTIRAIKVRRTSRTG